MRTGPASEWAPRPWTTRTQRCPSSQAASMHSRRARRASAARRPWRSRRASGGNSPDFSLASARRSMPGARPETRSPLTWTSKATGAAAVARAAPGRLPVGAAGGRTAGLSRSRLTSVIAFSKSLRPSLPSDLRPGTLTRLSAPRRAARGAASAPCGSARSGGAPPTRRARASGGLRCRAGEAGRRRARRETRAGASAGE